MSEKMFGKVMVRQLSEEEARNLTPDSVIYVAHEDFDPEEHGLVLVEARITDAAAEGGYWPVIDVFGASGHESVKWRGMFVADQGEHALEAKLVLKAGTHFDLGLIFPELEPDEVQERVFTVLRKEFGEGVIGIVQASLTAVSAVKYDVYERVTITTGRGKTREQKEVDTLVAEAVYKPQALAVKPQSSGTIVITLHKPKTVQMPTI